MFETAESCLSDASGVVHGLRACRACRHWLVLCAGVAGLLGAAFNSMRMWLWRLRASKTRHVLRIGEVRSVSGDCLLPQHPALAL